MIFETVKAIKRKIKASKDINGEYIKYNGTLYYSLIAEGKIPEAENKVKLFDQKNIHVGTEISIYSPDEIDKIAQIYVDCFNNRRTAISENGKEN